MSITHIETVSTLNVTSGSAVTATFGATPSDGEALVMVAVARLASGTGGNEISSWTAGDIDGMELARVDDMGNFDKGVIGLAYKIASSESGADMTCTFSGTVTQASCSGYRFSADGTLSFDTGLVDSLSTDGWGTGTSCDLDTNGNATQANSCSVAAVGVYGTSGDSYASASAAMTDDVDATQTNISIGSSYRIVTSTTQHATTLSWHTARAHGAVMATFIETAAGGVTVYANRRMPRGNLRGNLRGAL